MNECDKIVIIMNNLLTKKANTIGTNTTNTASINFQSKKEIYILRDIFFIQLY